MSTDLKPGAPLRTADHTRIERPSLCPELELRVIDRNSALGRAIRRHGLYAVHEVFGGLQFPPHWGYAFAGGQALARFVLDHPEQIAGRNVLDIGTGSGLVAIAAARAGARRVTAIDRDPLALEAARNNASLNGVSIEVAGWRYPDARRRWLRSAARERGLLRGRRNPALARRAGPRRRRLGAARRPGSGHPGAGPGAGARALPRADGARPRVGGARGDLRARARVGGNSAPSDLLHTTPRGICVRSFARWDSDELHRHALAITPLRMESNS